MRLSKFLKSSTVLGAIAVAAALVYYRGAPHGPKPHPLLAELDRLRTETQLLLDKTTRQISVVEPPCAKLRETEADLDSRCRDLAVSVEESRRAVEGQEQVLRDYATLVEKDQGAVLPDGKYISDEMVYRQFEFEKEKHRQLRQTLEMRSATRETIDRLRAAAKQRLDQSTKMLAELRGARDQLQQQSEHIKLLAQTFSAAGLSEQSLERDVIRLQREIAAIQDQLDVQFDELPETIVIEQLESIETSLVRKRKVVP